MPALIPSLSNLVYSGLHSNSNNIHSTSAAGRIQQDAKSELWYVSAPQPTSGPFESWSGDAVPVILVAAKHQQHPAIPSSYPVSTSELQPTSQSCCFSRGFMFASASLPRLLGRLSLAQALLQELPSLPPCAGSPSALRRAAAFSTTTDAGTDLSPTESPPYNPGGSLSYAIYHDLRARAV